MPYFTKYAKEKFLILNKYKVYLTQEQIEDVINSPIKTGKNGNYFNCEKDGIKVILKKENNINKVITFFPVK
jgi:type III secretory pathway component EscV